MKLTLRTLKDKCLTKTMTFQSEVLDQEVTIRELTIFETEELERLTAEGKTSESTLYMFKHCLVLDEDLSNEDLINFSKNGFVFIIEVLNKYPLIGKTKEEIDELKKKKESPSEKKTQKEVRAEKKQ